MKVVIAEKPSVAKELAKVLGATSAKDGYIEGNGYVFTWAFGHLVQLAPPQVYGFTEWKKENLPMLPTSFQLSIKMNKVGKDWKEDAGVKKQLNVIKSCFEKADEIIVATDAGREGELIFRYIYEYLQCKKPFRRLWISSFTDKAIKEGFSSLKSGKSYDDLFYSARSRAEADWLVGLNATQALSLSMGSGVYSIGRVQTPTLAMICERFLKNKNHKVEYFYVIEGTGNKNGVSFNYKSETKFDHKEVCESICAALKTPFLVHSFERKEKKEGVPLLFDLTELQREGNKKYGLSADDTLAEAQSLYEKKHITYPRTGSRYIGDDIFEQMPALIATFNQSEKYGKFAAAATTLHKKSVNAEKVTDHHALLPTEVHPNGLSGKEAQIYDLIVSRMFEAFGEDCIKRISTVRLKNATPIADDLLFASKGTEILKEGWRAVNSVKKDEEDEEETIQTLPDFTEGEKVSVENNRVVQKETKPQPIHTEATLLSAMETCGKSIEDEAAREAMKEGGLGTPATRAAIIETLLKRNYIERKKKSLIPTEKGVFVYELVKEKSIGKAEMTGEWEKKLSLIAAGKFDAGQFNSSIADYTKEIVTSMLSIDASTKPQSNDNMHKCPKCGKKTLRFLKTEKFDGLTCSDRACGLFLWRSVAGVKLTDSVMLNLVEKGKSGKEIKGFKKKAGGTFNAKLVLKGEKVEFDFSS